MKNWVLLFAMSLAMTSCGCQQIETGTVGIEKTWKEVQPKALTSGFHWYNPFSTDIEEFDIKETRIDIDTLCYTKDTQTAKITMSVNVSIDPNAVISLYSKVQHQWPKTLLEPAVLSGTKDVVGQFIADELVGKREEVRTAVLAHVAAKMAPYGILISSVAFTNIDFDDAYEKAIEAKVVAVQKAAEAKNKTVEIEEQGKQRLIQAEAEAKAITIQTEALSKSKSLIEFEAVKRWDGKLPQYMMGGSSVPMISLPNKQ